MRLVYDSHISGEFEGWDGDKVYLLDNGSRWEMTSYRYSYRYSYRPRAQIWDDGGQFLLEVDGMSEKVRVRRA